MNYRLRVFKLLKIVNDSANSKKTMNRRIGIIPARMGSKRIPNKNIRNFCGKPMILHIIETARSSKLFDVLHVSTDSHEISNLVASQGLEVDFLRPSYLADDHTPIMPVLKFVLEEYLKNGAEFDCVALLMACAPMITADDLRGAAALFDLHDKQQAVLGVAEYPCPVEWAFRREPNGVLLPVQPGMFSVRSQDLVPSYYDAGQFCFMPTNRVINSLGAGTDKDFIGYPIQRNQAIDIDTIEDWKFAELVFTGLQKLTEKY